MLITLMLPEPTQILAEDPQSDTQKKILQVASDDITKRQVAAKWLSATSNNHYYHRHPTICHSTDAGMAYG